MTTALEPRAQGFAIDREAVLRTLNLDPRNPATQALLLVCERYGLDPLLKHMVLIQGRPYVTRDGYLHIAHVSGQLDGIEILDEGEDTDYWWAKVAVYRKDMGRPFAYRGRYPKSGGNKTYGPEMAIKCAEVAALRRAFNVTGIGAADEKWDAEDEHTVDVPAVDPTLDGWASREAAAEAHRLLGECIAALPDEQKAQVREACPSWPMPYADFTKVEDLLIDLGRVDDDAPDDAEALTLDVDPEMEPF